MRVYVVFIYYLVVKEIKEAIFKRLLVLSDMHLTVFKKTVNSIIYISVQFN